jgi:hypothetical protein
MAGTAATARMSANGASPSPGFTTKDTMDTKAYT